MRRRRFPALCPAPYKWRMPGEIPGQPVNSRGTGPPAWHWAHHCAHRALVGFTELPVLGSQRKKTPRGSHFSYISNISAKSQRAEVGRDFLRSPRQGQGQAEQDHVQLGFQYPHGENQALPHWQLLHLLLFSQTGLLRVFCQQESCSKEGLAVQGCGDTQDPPCLLKPQPVPGLLAMVLRM